MNGATEVRDAEKPGTGVTHAQRNGGLSDVVSQPVNSITELLRFAVDKGTRVEELKELVALHEHMEERQARKEFFAALAKFQAECPPIIRESKATVTNRDKGTQFTYDYAKKSAIARVAGPHLVSNGFSYTFDQIVSNGMNTTTCTLRHVAGHSEKSSFTVPTESTSGASPQQKYCIADSYAQRRSFSSVLGISTTSEDEAGDDVDPTVINEDQVTHIDDQLREVGANRVKFLKYMEVDSLEQIRAVDYKTALAAIEDYRAAKARKSEAAT